MGSEEIALQYDSFDPAKAARAPRRRIVLRRVDAFFVVLLCAMAVLPTPILSQSADLSVPENAHAKSYGDGWNCDLSYRADGDGCIAIVVPAHAYPTNRSYGTGWDCLHGFKNVDDVSCAEVAVPDGGYLDSSGERWKCLRGFRKVADGCQEIVLPDNAYLEQSDRGSGWQCERGYATTGDQCAAIDLPRNSHLDRSGNRWECNRNFQRSRGRCVLKN